MCAIYEGGEGRESVKGNLKPVSLMAPELCLLIPVWLSQKRVMQALDIGVDSWENWAEGAGVSAGHTVKGGLGGK